MHRAILTQNSDSRLLFRGILVMFFFATFVMGWMILTETPLSQKYPTSEEAIVELCHIGDYDTKLYMLVRHPKHAWLTSNIELSTTSSEYHKCSDVVDKPFRVLVDKDQQQMIAYRDLAAEESQSRMVFVYLCLADVVLFLIYYLI